MLFARAFLLSWFIIDLTLAASGWFERYSVVTLFAFGAIASASGFWILHSISEGFRGFLQARSLTRLTLSQILRYFGVLALIKADQHTLPVVFAAPTGILDVIFATTSFFVAAWLVTAKGKPKRGFAAWHILGLTALGTSVILAILTSSPRFGLVQDGVTSQAMTKFPVSMVPTFIGPLMVIFHFLALTATHRQQSGER